MPNPTLYSYYYKKTNSSSYTLVPGKENITSTTCTVTGLIQGSNYDIKVTVKDNAGNIGIGEAKSIQTGTIEGATEGLKSGTIIAERPTWSNGKASITLSTNTGLKIQYSKGSSSGPWTDGRNVTGISHNTIVYARLTDGTNVGYHASVRVIDGITPEPARVSNLPIELKEKETRNITVTLTDNQSGINLNASKWVFNTNANTTLAESLYTNSFRNSNTITISGATAGTYYLHVLSVDNAGKKHKQD